jgi:uncharacterized protein (TIGR03083 family)
MELKEWKTMLARAQPVEVMELFAEERAALLALLGELSAEEWQRPTGCAGWSVRDVAAHILGGDLGNIALRRDRYQGLNPADGEPFLAFINRINEEWMVAARRLSPRLLVELLTVSGWPLFDYFASLDGRALGGAVTWAGPGPAPVWLDIAREYTERWHHQQHIRDAVGRPGLTEARFLYPVLATFAHALPVAFNDVPAEPGTAVTLSIEGAAGGEWSVVREAEVWRLYQGSPAAPAARLSLDADSAWRLFTKGVGPEVVKQAARVEGDAQLAENIYRAVAIIA